MSINIAHSPSNELTPSNKRQRTDEDEPLVKIVESKELWLDDGNIVVRTTSTSTPTTQTLYKVHKGTLALHSSTFASLFSGPQDAFNVGSERYNGVPVMDLPDAEEDVRDFLKALYFPSETTRHRFVSSPYAGPFSDSHWAVFQDSYSGILRLAVKYEAPLIRKVIADILEMEWPQQLDDWDRVQGVLNEKIDSLYGEEEDVTPYYPNPSRAIRLATDCDIPNVLPIAYYDLMRLLNDVDRALESQTRDFDTSALTADELRKLITGQTLLQKTFRGSIKKFKPPHTPSCAKDHACQHAVSKWLDRQQIRYRGQESDPLRWLETASRWCDDSRITVCPECRMWMSDTLESIRRKLWLGLPEYFGLVSAVMFYAAKET
ncbi:hypothetical protein BV25DRAFT_1894861 [Artomyces pyxidatus]|uniref:Uncharacterized protein n=1 Tax=Artomyces pyxidatus TaxID=48021 RepID=A0ACB8SJL3_9AGAM|nr:hypothetical protein BV25DRAFT_1894861 [Artomyces pyxidatus]